MIFKKDFPNCTNKTTQNQPDNGEIMPLWNGSNPYETYHA
jgi:hypothetical protein